MKTKLFTVLALVVLAITGFVINNSKVSSPSEVVKSAPLPQQIRTNNSWLDTFYIGAIDANYDYDSNYQHLNRLGFNLWHSYLNQEDGNNTHPWYPQMLWPGFSDDKLMNSIDSYKDHVNGFINTISDLPAP